MRERTAINATIQKLLKEARDKDPHSSFQTLWDRVRKENPKLFGDLEAQDLMEDDKAKEQEKAEQKNTVNLDDGSYHNSLGRSRPGWDGKHYPDVREQIASRSQRTEFTLAQHKAFMDQMRRGESFYVQAES
jgi:hypothetical protein